MGAALLAFVGLALGIGLVVFGLLGWFAAAAGNGDKDVTTGDYILYGSAAVLLGVAITGATLHLGGW